MHESAGWAVSAEKHTPGPWRAHVAVWPHEIIVRSMFPDGQERAQVAVTSAANARLIAAAPDLLEALARYVQQDLAHGLTANNLHRAARAAIANATGEGA